MTTGDVVELSWALAWSREEKARAQGQQDFAQWAELEAEITRRLLDE